MDMFHLVNSEVVDLTPEFAKKFRDLPGSPTEREFKEKRVLYLREKALSGQLVNFNWVTAQLEDKEFRMNGQHSSSMLCNLNDENFPTGLKVHFDKYKVDNLEGLALLFRQFDDRHSSRSLFDISGAYQGLYEDLKEVPREVAKIGIESVVWWNRNVEGLPAPSGDDVYAMLGDDRHHKFLKWLGSILSIKTPELKMTTVVAATFATYTTNPHEAGVFWEHVARGGVEFNETHPTTVLDNWLRDAKEGEKKKLMGLKPGQFYQGCIYCWNAYREEKPIKETRYDIRKGFMPVMA